MKSTNTATWGKIHPKHRNPHWIVWQGFSWRNSKNVIWKRKRTNQENPQTIPGQIGKIPKRTKNRRCTWTVYAICLNHFILIDVCSIDILIECLRISTGFKGDSLRETHLWEHFGRTDKIALIPCLKSFNVSSASLKKGQERTNRDGRVQIGKPPPPFETPPV